MASTKDSIRRTQVDIFVSHLQMLLPKGRSDWMEAFVDAVMACPTLRLKLKPADLLLDPISLSPDMRISLCVVYGQVHHGLVFPGSYDRGEAGLVTMEIIRAAVRQYDQIRHDSFMTWMKDGLRLRGHEVEYEQIKAWGTGLHLPHMGLARAIAGILGVDPKQFEATMERCDAPPAPPGYARRSWRGQSRIDTYLGAVRAQR